MPRQVGRVDRLKAWGHLVRDLLALAREVPDFDAIFFENGLNRLKRAGEY